MTSTLNKNNLYSHMKNFIPVELATLLLELLRDGVNWQPFPLSPNSRLCAGWSYGGQRELDKILENLIIKIQQLFQIHINSMSVFLNWYKNGQDYCPYHSDKYNSDVFTISLGNARDLLIKQNGHGKAKKINLQNGDLYYMSNAMQFTHKHSIPKRKNADERISVVLFGKI